MFGENKGKRNTSCWFFRESLCPIHCLDITKFCTWIGEMRFLTENMQHAYITYIHNMQHTYIHTYITYIHERIHLCVYRYIHIQNLLKYPSVKCKCLKIRICFHSGSSYRLRTKNEKIENDWGIGVCLGLLEDIWGYVWNVFGGYLEMFLGGF